jgi:hypothetical protein
MGYRYAFVQKVCVTVLLAFAVGCTAPRSVINSGKVTTQGQVRVGINFGGNLATSPMGQLDDIARSAVDALSKKDSVVYDEQVEAITKAFLAYSLDPVGPTFDFYLRYGLAQRVDVGYKYASGVHVFDTQYQFLGPTGTPDNPGVGDWYGSVGLQYAGQSTDWIDKLFLNKLQPVLQFSAKRRDVTVPLIFSRSLGLEEENGHIGFGLVYNYTSIRYGFEPSRLYRERGVDEYVKLEGVREKNNFSSYGFFVNGKLGFKYVYVLPALTVYYQDYGTYKLLEGRQHSFSGLTFIPSIGLQANFGGGRAR